MSSRAQTDSRAQAAQVGIGRAVGLLITGVVLTMWVVFGRFLFGVGGELTFAYLVIGVFLIVLYAYIARAHVRIRARGFTARGSTWGTLIAAVAGALVLGLTIPDVTASGLQTILSGPNQPWLDVAIGIANPAGTIMVAFTSITLVLASQDARGPRPSEDDH